MQRKHYVSECVWEIVLHYAFVSDDPFASVPINRFIFLFFWFNSSNGSKCIVDPGGR